jgi:hypothetical protein
MKKQPVHRDYNFPDPDLYAQCLERLKYIARDKAEFLNYAYGEEKIANFEALCKAFEALPTDDELLGEQMTATQKKYDQREKLKTAIRNIMTRVETKYDSKTGRYRKFGTAKLHEMNDPNIILCGHRVMRVATAQMTFLVETGLRDTHVDSLREACAAFENAVHIQLDKVSDRDIAVESRVELCNKMYAELVLVCNIGKDIWAETNRTKYDNYCIYESNAEQKRQHRQKLKAEAETKEASEE